MDVLPDLLYTDKHEWIRVESAVGTVGITEHAQDRLGDVTYVELPAADIALAQDDEVGDIESCKAVAILYSPVSGKVVAANAGLEGDPGLVNRDPYGDGWIFKIAIANADELAELLQADAYAKLCEEDTD